MTAAVAGDADSATLATTGAASFSSAGAVDASVIFGDTDRAFAGTLLRGGVFCARGGAAATRSFSPTAGGRAVMEAGRALGGAGFEAAYAAASSRTSGGGALGVPMREAPLVVAAVEGGASVTPEGDGLVVPAASGGVDSDFGFAATLGNDFASASLRTASAIARVPERDVGLRVLLVDALLLDGFAFGVELPAAFVAEPFGAAMLGVFAAAGSASSAQSESISSVAGGIDVVTAASAAGSSPHPESRSSSAGATDSVLALRRAEASAMSVKVPASCAMASPK